MRLKRAFKTSVLIRSLRLLERRDRRRIIWVIISQVLMGFLDLIGVALIGIIGALSINGVQSKLPGDRVSSILKFFSLQGETLQFQVGVLGATAASLLILRTVLSVVITRKILFFLSRRGAQISKNLTEKLLSQNMLVVQKKTAQETLYALTAGVSAITLRLIGTFVALISDLALLIVMGSGLFILDPAVALGSLGVFSIVGYILYQLMHARAEILGEKESYLNIKSNEKIIEVIETYREAVVRNRRHYYARQIGDLRYALSDTLAEVSFFPNIGKYVIEITVVFGAFVLAAVQFLLQDASHAIATLAIFLAAGTRIAPAVLRIQQGSVTMRGAIGAAAPTLDLIDQFKSTNLTPTTDSLLQTCHEGFQGKISLSDVSFSYPDSSDMVVNRVNLEIDEGEFVAIVGPSGAGKTTLIDLILGILEPTNGQVLISEEKPLSSINLWPGSIAYVPQDALIINGTIKENIQLGFPDSEKNNDFIWDALRLSGFEDFVNTLPGRIDYEVGEKGARLSGGQRQRLVISRALFSKPKLLVLDEATSALDGQTEADVSRSVLTLRGKTTVLMIAHRLSTVTSADKVIYIDRGNVIAQGSFAEVRAKVPDFEKQAQLMGL
jgi:ABC-type multidrug transport system fused ATPase/permease subunit